MTDLGDAANDAPSDRAALVQMAKMGWVGLAIAEEFGGAGGTIVDLALW